jgi:hypothetical protein
MFHFDCTLSFYSLVALFRGHDWYQRPKRFLIYKDSNLTHELGWQDKLQLNDTSLLYLIVKKWLLFIEL